MKIKITGDIGISYKKT